MYKTRLNAEDFPEVKHGSLHICQFSSSTSSRLGPKDNDFSFFFFCSLIFNPWETFFLSQQIKEGWVRCQGPDQLSQAAISTVLSLWHARKTWALSKAEGAISQPSKLFSSILLYLPLLIFFSSAIIPLPHLTFSSPSIVPLIFHPLIQLHTTTTFQFLIDKSTVVFKSYTSVKGNKLSAQSCLIREGILRQNFVKRGFNLSACVEQSLQDSTVV